MLSRFKSFLLCLSAAVIALDQSSKWLVERTLGLYERVDESLEDGQRRDRALAPS